MEEKKAVVRTVLEPKKQTGPNGDYFIHTIAFDNGDTGQYFTKTFTQDVFKLGIEVAYTIETTVKGKFTNVRIRPVKQAGFVARTVNPVYENRRTALKCAVDLCVSGKIEKDNVLTQATYYLKFLTGE